MSVYITGTGRFLPGPAIDNDTMESVLGLVGGKPSRLKRRILKANGIRARHYAIDAAHDTCYSNEELAVAAARACIDSCAIAPARIGMLSVATSQGDYVLPGFGSMVQAGLSLAGVELNTAHGICSSSVMAFKTAYNALKVGDHEAALVVASELVSRNLKHTRYEAAGGRLESDAEFLRWMLSDGAGAVMLETRPRGPALRVDWVRSFSHAESFPLCMSVGGASDPDDGRTWQDFPDFASAEVAGSLLLRQDVRLLDQVVKLGVDGALRLIDEGVLDVGEVDHFLCHYSSHHFRGRILELLDKAGALIPTHKWFSNLYTRGNTGSASIFVMLDEFVADSLAKPGDQVLCMVPESGRFNTAYVHLTKVDGDG